MKISNDSPRPVSSDLEQIARHLSLQDARLLELGCGRAEATRTLAESFPIKEIIATEVDRIQHERNLHITDLPQVTFKFGGAEAIDMDDDAVDSVIMLKSLHHVPLALLDQALEEIRRVLKPNGLAYISEPIYGGEFNDILRLFHDEKTAREAAFAAIERAVDSEKYDLVDELFFDISVRFNGFEEFEERILGATHSEFELDDELYAEIKQRFSAHIDGNGVAEFLAPHRLDLLRPAG